METENEETLAAKKIDFILFIDDDEIDNELHCEILIRAGLSNKIECFTHALEALTYFKNCLTERPNKKYPVPDLVFLDLLMPFYDGFQFLDEYRKLADPYQRKQKIKFVMITGLVDPALSLRAKAYYGDLLIGCTQKPLDPELIRKLAVKHF